MSIPVTAGPLLLLLLSLSSATSDLSGDISALQSFRSAVAPLLLPSWNSSSPTCAAWQGVACDPAGRRVVSLRLPAISLAGRIPSGSLGNLTALRTLSLRFNALSGPLPDDLAGLSELRNLYLQRNRFSGEIPASLASLRNLVRLNLAGNRFSGKIPPGIGKLPRLATLYVEENRLTGGIPSPVSTVEQLNVSNNRLSGSIPRKLRSFPASAFLNTGLCGGPLGPCSGDSSPSPAPETAGSGGGSHKLSGGAIAGIAIGASVFLLIVILVLVVAFGKTGGVRKTKTVHNGEMGPVGPFDDEEKEKDITNGNLYATTAPASAKGEAGKGGGSKNLVFFGGSAGPFDLEELLRASAEVLGKGTFGTAYKAVLESGVTVAVKRLKDVGLSEGEFRERIEAVGAMNHPNLVPLRAYYFSRDEKLLVYDFVSDGSLSALLHGNRGSGRTPLNWETRLNISLSAAQGIEYIHSTSPSASHGNIKSSNILLSKSEARVSDHGLALICAPSTKPARIAGYRAPEVTDTRKISQKADVYSFGVLLLELLTGKAPAQSALNEELVDLPRWVQSVVREEWTAEVFDTELLRYKNVEEEMVQLLQLALECTAQYPDKRPDISDVVVCIEEIKRSSLGAANRDRTIKPSSTEGDDGNHSSRADSPDGVWPSS